MVDVVPRQSRWRPAYEGRPTPAQASLGSSESFSWHMQKTMHLAGPVILTRVTTASMLTVDVLVLGEFGTEALADYVLGQALVHNVITMLNGLLLGVPVLVAREKGRTADADLGKIWRRGLVYALAAGAILCLALQSAEMFFRAAGQTPDLAARGAAVSTILAWMMPFVGLYLVSLLFLEALHRPWIGVTALLLGNLCNFVLNILLVFGAGPIPALGAQGCALATVITSTALAIGLGLYVRARLAKPRAQPNGGDRQTLLSTAQEQRRIGHAAGACYGLEAASFMAMMLIVSWLGQLELAAYGILFQVLALPFMVSRGIGVATQVRVSDAWGRGDVGGMRKAGWSGLLLSALCSTAVALLVVAMPGLLVALFVDDLRVAALAEPAMVWVAVAVVFHGGQAVMNSVCRGSGDTWVPTAFQLTCFWGLMVPLAFVFAHDLGRGVAGVCQGIALSCVVSLGLLTVRFAWMCNQRLNHSQRGRG